MNEENEEKDIYQQKGYKSRIEYLYSLAEEYGLDFYKVKLLSALLGPREDFDGLISMLDDLGNGM